VQLSVGKVRGNAWATGEEYLMIPYASAERFESPTLRDSLPGPTFDATNILGFGEAACLQPNEYGPHPPPPLNRSKEYGTENCLILNMYKPLDNGSENGGEEATLRPILIWIFGGDNTLSEIIPYNATMLAGQHNAIVVVVSYRLGVFGFSAFKEDKPCTTSCGNNGMYDILAAAEWIKREAKNLGGDPDR
jgi:para-nitrobenzyl esterase